MNSLEDVESHIGTIAITQGLWSLLLNRRAGYPRDYGWCRMSRIPDDPKSIMLTTIDGRSYKLTVEPVAR